MASCELFAHIAFDGVNNFAAAAITNGNIYFNTITSNWLKGGQFVC